MRSQILQSLPCVMLRQAHASTGSCFDRLSRTYFRPLTTPNTVRPEPVKACAEPVEAGRCRLFASASILDLPPLAKGDRGGFSRLTWAKSPLAPLRKGGQGHNPFFGFMVPRASLRILCAFFFAYGKIRKDNNGERCLCQARLSVVFEVLSPRAFSIRLPQGPKWPSHWRYSDANCRQPS